MKREDFVRLVQKYGNRMFYIARGRLRDEHLAEDAVQEACEKVWRNWSRLHFKSETQAWKYLSIALNTTVVDIARRRPEQECVSFSELLADPTRYGFRELSAEGNLSAREEAGRVLELMERLGPKYYEALSLRAEGYSNSEIAKLMDISVYDVGVVIHRGRKRLKELMEKEGMVV